MLILKEHQKINDTPPHDLMQSVYMYVIGKGVSKCGLTGLNASYNVTH